MTSEQIAELRMLTVKLPSRVDIHVKNGPAGEKTGEFVKAVLLTLPHILPKLLDEREALLEALRHVEWGGDSFQGFAAVCPDCVAHEGKPHEPDCVLAAALAKAESP